MITLRKVFEIMAVLGIPTISTLVIGVIHTIKAQGKRISILMEAQQAQMRRDLMQDYRKHKQNGWITPDAMDEWEKQYQAYHQLGLNGVLDARRQELLSLPLESDY